MRWPRSPLFHYLLVGGALFLGHRRWLEPGRSVPAAQARPAIVISAGRQREVLERFGRDTGAAPTADDARALLQREIDAELLYREALALGLDRGDRSIRWQLVRKMSFIEGVDEEAADSETLYRQAQALGFDQDDPVIRNMMVEKMRLLVKARAALVPVDEAALAAHFAAVAERFRQPPRITFRQVFFGREQRGDRAATDARALFDRLQAGAPSPTVSAAGDAFPLGSVVRAQSPTQIARSFGDAFASAIAQQPVGGWTMLSSALGVHLVLVEAATPGALPSLDGVRGQVFAEVVAERGDAELTRFLTDLHARYAVRVESTDGRAS